MPQFNPWIHQPLHSSTLEHMYRPPKQRVQEKVRQFAGELGYAAGSAVALPASYGIRRFGQWYYPQERVPVSTYTPQRYRPRSYTQTVTTRRRKKYKKVCCRRIKGKKYCSPEFCEKRKRKYWY